MTPQDRISLSITFVVGFLVGAYLYTTGFATTFKLPEANEAGVYTGFVLVGEAYGACREEQSCVTFQVLENGVYRAIFDTDSKGNKQVVREGRLPRHIRQTLKRELTAEGLASQSQVLAQSTCAFEGTNYRFQITLEQLEYELDTCQSAVAYDSSSWRSLTEVYNYIAGRQ